MKVLLDPRAARALEAHALGAYPEEACGFLLGTDGEPRRILEARPTENVEPEGRSRRYTIDPRAILRLERELAGGRLALLGFYHSHPDHPARPSAYDRERGWPWYTYVIVAVAGGRPRELRAWRLDEGAGLFKEEDLIIAPASPEAR